MKVKASGEIVTEDEVEAVARRLFSGEVLDSLAEQRNRRRMMGEDATFEETEEEDSG